MVFPAIAGSSNGDGGCSVDYTATLECDGDPSIPNVSGILFKFEPIEGDCEPGNIGSGTIVFYSDLPPVFELEMGKSGFKKLLWPQRDGSVGSYDIVAEIITNPGGMNGSAPEAIVERVIIQCTVWCFVIQRRPGVGEPLEMELAGTSQSRLRRGCCPAE